MYYCGWIERKWSWNYRDLFATCLQKFSSYKKPLAKTQPQPLISDLKIVSTYYTILKSCKIEPERMKWAVSLMGVHHRRTTVTLVCENILEEAVFISSAPQKFRLILRYLVLISIFSFFLYFFKFSNWYVSNTNISNVLLMEPLSFFLGITSLKTTLMMRYIYYVMTIQCHAV